MITFLAHAGKDNKHHKIGRYECSFCGGVFSKRIRRRDPLPHSCGCSHRATKHGHDRIGKRTPELRAWHKIRERCTNPNNKDFPYYGGRGIAVDPRWDDFVSFFADMGPRPEGKFTIERIDVDGNYSPENCIWLHKSEQAKNRRNTQWITAGGETLCMSEWVRKLNISKTNLYRKRRQGISLEQQIQEIVRRLSGGATDDE